MRLASAILASSVRTTSTLALSEKAGRALKLNWESGVLGEIATVAPSSKTLHADYIFRDGMDVKKKNSWSDPYREGPTPLQPEARKLES